jgi:hypothetical protein
VACQQDNQHFEECCTGRLARQFTSLGKKNRLRKGRYLGLAPNSRYLDAKLRFALFIFEKWLSVAKTMFEIFSCQAPLLSAILVKINRKNVK